MEEKTTTTTTENPKPRSSRFNIWKLLTLVILAIVLFGGAYYLGMKKNNNVALAPTPTPSASQAPNSSPSASTNPSQSSTPTPSAMPSKSISGGGNIGVFMPYKIQVPNDWTSAHTSAQDVLDDLTITRDGYKISIHQAGGEGAICNYGAPSNDAHTQNYPYYKEVSGGNFSFRRSGTASTSTSFTICDGKQQGFGFPTFYGYISYSVPTNPDQLVLAEMDAILATISKQ